MTIQALLASVRVSDWTQSRDQLNRVRMTVMRVVATLLLLIGLARGAFVLGLSPIKPEFLEVPLSVQAWAVALAVLTLIAASGLWMAAAWGTALWASVVLCETLVYFVGEPAYAGSGFKVAAHAVVFAAYATFTRLLDRRRRSERWKERDGWVDE